MVITLLLGVFLVPERLQLKNFMCYRDDLPPLEFEGVHVACLSGDNGAGKSALLDAITWALWGRARLSSDDELIAQGATDMEVDFQFGLNGQSYRVIRKRSRSKRGQSALEFQARNGQGWKVLTEATLRETQHSLTTLLRIDYDTFINSAFLLQGRADEFTSRKKPAERKQVLADILGLTAYDELQQAAKERASGFEKQAFGKQSLLADLERRAGERPKYLELLGAAEAQVATIEAELLQAEALRTEIAERRRVLTTQREVLAEAQRQQHELDAECAGLRAEAALLQDRQEEALALQARRDEIVRGLAALDDAEEHLALLEGLVPEFERLRDERAAAEARLADDERVLRTEYRLAEGLAERLEARARERDQLLRRIDKGVNLLAELIPARDELGLLREQRAVLVQREAALRETEEQRRMVEAAITLRKQSLIASREEAGRTIKRIDERLAEQPRWQKAFDSARRAAQEIESLQAELHAGRDAEATLVEAAGALRAESSRIEEDGKLLAEKLGLLDHDAATCPLCSNNLGHDGVDRIRARYEQERHELRSRLREARQQATEHEAALQQQRATLATSEARVQALRHTAAQADGVELRLREAAAERVELRHQHEVLASLVAQLEGGTYAEVEREQLAAIDARLVAEHGSSADLRQQIEELTEQLAGLERQDARIERYQGELATLREQQASAEAELHGLPEALARRDEAARQLAAGDFGHETRGLLEQLAAALATLGYSREAHEAARQAMRQLGHWRGEAQRLAQTDALATELAAQQQRLAESLARREAEQLVLAGRVAQLVGSAHELLLVEQRHQEIEARVAALRRQRDAALSDCGQYRQRLDDAQGAAEQLLAEQGALLALRSKQALYDELSLSLGKKGVQAMLIETAIPEIEQEANRLLSRMTDNQMHLSFETQRDTKKGDTVETLEIKIADALGTRAYESFSGGEAFRVNFAIRVALARLLARRTGATLETLVIDEGFGTQDARGRERLVDAITSVQHDFRRILVVTHIQELKDLFPVQIEITKTESGSVWAVL